MYYCVVLPTIPEELRAKLSNYIFQDEVIASMKRKNLYDSPKDMKYAIGALLASAGTRDEVIGNLYEKYILPDYIITVTNPPRYTNDEEAALFHNLDSGVSSFLEGNSEVKHLVVNDIDELISFFLGGENYAESDGKDSISIDNKISIGSADKILPNFEEQIEEDGD